MEGRVRPLQTMKLPLRRISALGGIPAIVMVLTSFWLAGCGDSTPPLTVTLTFKKDGSHFNGTVVRREPNSITITGTDGDAHTFLYSELSDIKYGSTDEKTDFSSQLPSAPESGGGSGSQATTASADVLQFPQGTTLPIRSNGFLDSCCVPIGAFALGFMDADIKNAKGAVVIPRGANVTFTLRDEKMVDGRVTMEFELGSVDFNNRHYLINSVKGGNQPGAVLTLTGPKEGSAEANARGKSLHVDDNSAMAFKAETPIVVKSSQ